MLSQIASVGLLTVIAIFNSSLSHFFLHTGGAGTFTKEFKERRIASM